MNKFVLKKKAKNIQIDEHQIELIKKNADDNYYIFKNKLDAGFIILEHEPSKESCIDMISIDFNFHNIKLKLKDNFVDSNELQHLYSELPTPYNMIKRIEDIVKF